MAKQAITDTIFADEYAKFQNLFKKKFGITGTDADFTTYLNKNYVTKTGKPFTKDLTFYKRSSLGIKTPVMAGGPSPLKLKRFNEVNDFATKEVAKANLGNRFVRIEEIKNKVLKKFKLKSFPNFKSEAYPVLNNLDKIPAKIDSALKSMLISEQPLKQNFVDEIVKITETIGRDAVKDNLNTAPTYEVIKDQGADYIKKSKRFPKDFYNLSFSDQLPYAMEMKSGRPRYTGMGGEIKYSMKPQNKIMAFAFRSWDNNKGSLDGPVQFFKKGSNKPIVWKYGENLPWSEVEFSYKDIPGKKHSFDKLKSVNYMQKYFPEVYEKQKAVNNLNVRRVDNPFIPGEKISVRDLIKKIQVDGYKWKPRRGTLDILHGRSGVSLKPFTDLTYASSDLNKLEAGLYNSFQAGNISKSELNKSVKVLRQDIKGLTGETLDTAIINRQLDLSKQIQSGKISSYQDVKNLVLNNFIKQVKSVPGGCRAVVTKALGGKLDTCEAIIKADPERAAAKLNNAITATKGPLKNLKDDSQKMIRLFRGEEPNARTQLYKGKGNTPGMYDESLKGRFFFDNPNDARWYAQRQGSLTGNVKSVDVPEKYVNIGRKMSERRRGPRYGSEVVLPKKFVGQESLDIMQTARARGEALTSKITFDKIKGAFINRSTGDSVSSGELKTFAEENPIEVKAGTEDAFKPIKKSMLKTVGRTLAKVGAPLPTALIDGYFIGKQIQDDKPAVEIAKDPLNWLGLATMSTLTGAGGLTKAGVAAPGAMSSILRMGMNPGLIRGISRFAGLPGLAISTGLTAYDQYKKYQNEEGLIYNLFNDKSIPIN